MAADRKSLTKVLVKAGSALAAGGLLLTGCAAPTIYHWGSYEDLLYQQYIEPGSADPATQIAQLNKDIGEASEQGKPVPPGLHAHLGYLYFSQGNLHAAANEFAAEKNLFPESSTLIDSMLGRLKK